MRDFGRKMSFVKKIYRGAFHPPLIGSKIGLAGRIRRILKGRCSNPRTCAAWALGVNIAVTCLAIGIAFSQTLPEGRIVHFPKDRSVGQLSIRDAGAARELKSWFHWTDIQGPSWEYLCEAQGDVHISPGKQLSLNVNQTAWRDLSWLSRLGPNDLYELGITVLLTDPAKPSDECMIHIAHLTGLKSLCLDRTNVTDRGFEYIGNLMSLEYLHMPMQVTDKGMAYVAQLCSLKGLYFGQMGSQVSDAGLRHLAKLSSLQELALWGERIGDTGLAHLRGLPRLEYLFLYGTHFTDKGCVHLKEIPSLKILSFYEGRCQITGAGLVDVSKIATLESLSLNVTGPITDDGIAHLSKMRSLKKLDIANSQITDRGLGYLSQIKTLETLNLPQRDQHITDVGLAHLGQMPNLKSLSVTEAHYAIPAMNPDWYTDKGLAELANCRLLEELNIGSIGITDAGIDHIVKLNNLKKLMLFGCDNVTDAGLAKLTALKSLTNLYVADADISVKGLNNLKPMPYLTKLDVYPIKRNGAVLNISGLTAMEELHLSFEPNSQDSFVDADLKCLMELKRLRWLQIGPCNYTDKGLAYLAGLTNMERLGIGGSGLTDEGLKHLSNMKKLNLLSIVSGFDANKGGYVSGGNITDGGLRELEGLKLMSFLDIYSDNEFSDAALRRLWKELPNLFTLRINGGTLLKIGD